MTGYVWVSNPVWERPREHAQLWQIYKGDKAHHRYDPEKNYLRLGQRNPVSIQNKGWKLHYCSDEQNAAIDTLNALAAAAKGTLT